MISKRIGTKHMCLSIQGALHLTDKELNRWRATDDDGSVLSGKEVREILERDLAEGKRVIPMGTCDNFDYQTGCRGHDVTLLVHDWEFEEGNG